MSLLALIGAAPVPESTPPIAPIDPQMFIARAAVQTVAIFDLLVVAAESLAFAYMVTYLVKLVIKDFLRDDKYQKAMRLINAGIAAGAAGAVYYLTRSSAGAIAALIGAATAPIVHDIIDGIRGLKKP